VHAPPAISADPVRSRLRCARRIASAASAAQSASSAVAHEPQGKTRQRAPAAEGEGSSLDCSLARVSSGADRLQKRDRNEQAANGGGLGSSAGLGQPAAYFACTFFHMFTGVIGPSGVSTLLPVHVVVSP
jgi:hypothetical protein